MTQTQDRPAATVADTTKDTKDMDDTTAAEAAGTAAVAGADRLDRLDDEDYPAYSMGRAAELLGVTPAFLRNLGAAKLIEPLRSGGGHRRFSRYQLRLAQRARELVDGGTALDAACRIIILEDQLAEALRINTHNQQTP